MSDPIQQIVILTGCTRDAAEEAYALHRDVVIAVDSLLTTPPNRGAKFIPPPTKIDNGLTPEQEKICKRGRMVTDTLNSLTHSAYHSANQQAVSASQARLEELPPLTVHDEPAAESS